jgi:hypothetical protein
MTIIALSRPYKLLVHKTVNVENSGNFLTAPCTTFCVILLTARPPLWSCGQSSWLQIQFDSRLYQIFWELVDLEQGPLSLMSTIEEPLGRKSSGSGLEI